MAQELDFISVIFLYQYTFLCIKRRTVTPLMLESFLYKLNHYYLAYNLVYISLKLPIVHSIKIVDQHFGSFSSFLK